ncbi:karyopherin (importin) alpha 6 [Chelydra serpentina]|uniref:Karyopherin (Importin) alpha 6 n=1 Tax=Chelydra serpentina TaxID=8475 RepID=A0A8T1RVR7_CHESE|nr:karyopherin (importin) alpha 6 [Chelydra serpentina]
MMGFVVFWGRRRLVTGSTSLDLGAQGLLGRRDSAAGLRPPFWMANLSGRRSALRQSGAGLSEAAGAAAVSMDTMASPGKDNYRIKSYKNNALNPQEMRRRREEDGIQLRKQKREEQVGF